MFGDRSDETEASPWEGLDHRLSAAAVAKGSPDRVDTRVQRAIGNRAAVPDGVDQLVLGDDPVPVLDQVGEDGEHLRLESDRVVTVAELQARAIERVVVEAVNHDV